MTFTGAGRLDPVEMRAKYISRIVQDADDEISSVKNRKIAGSYSTAHRPLRQTRLLRS
jgi:hypothetical protein